MEIFGLIVILAALAVSVTIHEYMHGYMAYKLGDNTAKHSGRLTLNPLAHVDPITTVALPVILYIIGVPPFGAAKPVPFNPSNFRNGETGLAMVAAIGPFSNLVLAAIAGTVLQLFFSPGALGFDILALFIILNLAFFVFNMIPFPPLDGSRLLYVLAPEGVRRFMQTIESGGIFAIGLFIFIAFPFLSPLMSEAIGILSQWLAGTNLLYGL